MFGAKHGPKTLADDIGDDGCDEGTDKDFWKEFRSWEAGFRESGGDAMAGNVADGLDVVHVTKVQRRRENSANDDYDQLGGDGESAFAL